jgi:hypothetical protein
MFWRKKNGDADLNLGCQVDGCDFACHDYRVLQRHAGKKHAGLRLECKAVGCDYVCSDYLTLERHTSWAHPAALVPAVG